MGGTPHSWMVYMGKCHENGSFSGKNHINNINDVNREASCAVFRRRCLYAGGFFGCNCSDFSQTTFVNPAVNPKKWAALTGFAGTW